MADDDLSLVDARTPAEAKRHWMIDRLWIMYLVGTVFLLFTVVVVVWGVWPELLAAARLNVLTLVAMGMLAQQLLVGAYFAIGGPVGRWKARWGDKSLDMEDHGRAAQRAAYDGAAK